MSIRANRSSILKLVVIAAGLLVAAVLAIGLTVWWLRSDAVDDAIKDSDHLAIVLAEQTNRAVQSIDLVLEGIQGRLENLGAKTQDNFGHLQQDKTTYNSLTDSLSHLSQAALIALIDKNGRVVITTQKWPTPTIDLTNRDYFQHFKDIDDKGIYVGKLVADHTTGLETIFFGKRINDSNNAFLGMIVVGVRLSYFQHIYNSIASFPDQLFLLVRNDGTVIVRYPDRIDRAGEKIAAESPWYRMVSQGGGHFRSPSHFDSQTRLMAVRPLSDYPLVINVGISEAAALAGWRNQALTIGIGTLLMIICSVFLLKALTNHFKRLVNSEAALTDEQTKVDAALSSMLQGLVMFDSEARLVVCNQRYLDMYGLLPDIVKPGCPLSELLKQRVATDAFFAIDPEQYISELVTAAQQGTSVRKLTTLRDGRVISIINQPVAGGGWVATHEDVTELRRAEERISYAAHHDALTNLANRTLFGEQLDQALKRVGRGEHFAVLYLDLDNFKFVNDTLGHLGGDELLKAVAGRLQSCVRDLDTLARLGGDEFGIIQADVEQPSDVAYLAVRIEEALREPYEIAGHHFIVEASIGIAMCPDNGVEAEQLLKNADLAMYQAKANGRGTFCFFEREMDARVKARSALEFELRQAIMCNQFELFYQPVVNLQDSTITSFEALLRWHHPERGLISPAEFIPIAEETGLINQLGEWVLRTACTEAMTWPDNIKIAVNISPVQFNNQALVLTVIGALAASGLPARRLELEITETAIIHDEAATLVKLSQLREMGVQISLDDFGTGYSSLSYLHRIPFDKIKIDKSFIDNIASDDSSLAIVQAVITVANTRNVTVVAEGVETEQQREFLRMLGCSEMQGYLFSRPVPVQGLLEFFPTHAQTIADTASTA